MKVPTYKVTVLSFDKLIHYHVVNIKTKITHSHWRSMQSALTAMRDLNRMVR